MRMTMMVLMAGLFSALSATAGEDALKDFGAESAGLRAKVSLEQKTFASGKSIKMRFVVRNVSKADVEVWHSGFWPNHLIVVKDAQGKEVASTAAGKQGRAAFSPGGGRDKNFPVMLKPGDDDEDGRFDLTQYFDLKKSGKYTLQVVFEEKQGAFSGKVESNVLEFEVI